MLIDQDAYVQGRARNGDRSGADTFSKDWLRAWGPGRRPIASPGGSTMSSKTSREVLLLTPKDDLMPISGTRCAEENLLPPKSPGFVPRQTSHKPTRSHFGYSNKREWKDVLESSTLVEGTFCSLSSILGNVALAGRRGVGEVRRCLNLSAILVMVEPNRNMERVVGRINHD